MGFVLTGHSQTAFLKETNKVGGFKDLISQLVFASAGGAISSHAEGVRVRPRPGVRGGACYFLVIIIILHLVLIIGKFISYDKI